MLPLFVFVSANGFIVANSISGTLNNFPQIAGSASALIGAMQYGSGILGSALVSYFADGTPRPMAIVVAACSVGSLLCAQFLPKRKAALGPDASVAEVPGPNA